MSFGTLTDQEFKYIDLRSFINDESFDGDELRKSALDYHRIGQHAERAQNHCGVAEETRDGHHVAVGRYLIAANKFVLDELIDAFVPTRCRLAIRGACDCRFYGIDGGNNVPFDIELFRNHDSEVHFTAAERLRDVLHTNI